MVGGTYLCCEICRSRSAATLRSCKYARSRPSKRRKTRLSGQTCQYFWILHPHRERGVKWERILRHCCSGGLVDCAAIDCLQRSSWPEQPGEPPPPSSRFRSEDCNRATRGGCSADDRRRRERRHYIRVTRLRNSTGESGSSRASYRPLIDDGCRLWVPKRPSSGRRKSWWRPARIWPKFTSQSIMKEGPRQSEWKLTGVRSSMMTSSERRALKMNNRKAQTFDAFRHLVQCLKITFSNM